MCGICGQVSFKRDLRNYEQAFYNMQEKLYSRGPDQHGEYFSEDAVLMHRRLAVVDIEKGRQPMTYAVNGEMFTLCYNGELYNTDEIRNGLESRGYNFFSHSDTEVVLKAYCEYREECVKAFNGIFSFAVWEHTNKRLFVARDRMGVKPLFYSICKSGFVFASEIKALLEHPEIEAKMDIRSLSEIMLIGPGRTPGCGVFKDINELRPAHYAVYDEKGLKIERYWNVEAREHTDTLEQTVERVRYLVTDSIKRQLVSDVPLCTFLSGGLDSSLISSVTNEEFKKRGEVLHTFSVDYVDNEKYFKKSKFQPNSDPEFVRIMQNYLGGVHHWIMIDTDELVEALFSAVDARDLPGMADVDSSMLLLCKAIKEHGTVALSGECADEIFGGYPWFYRPEMLYRDFFPWIHEPLARASLFDDDTVHIKDGMEFMHEVYKQSLADCDTLDTDSDTMKHSRTATRLSVDYFMTSLLERKDRCSMASGLEVRVPFADHRILEYVYNVPWEIKFENETEKSLIRNAMADYLPDKILHRKKSPYPKTHNPEYEKTVLNMLNNRIEKGGILSKILKKDMLRSYLENSNTTWFGQLMGRPQLIAWLVQFDYFFEKYNVILK